MSIHSPEARNAQDAAQRQARIDLAAAHRVSVWHDLSEGIYNHYTLAIPGDEQHFLLAPFGLHWAEIRAGDFMKVDMQGRVVQGEGQLQRSAYCIHAPIHARHPRHACVLHTHAPYVSAIARLENPELLPIGQTEILLLNHIAYDHHYDGLARDTAEGERLADALGDKTILIMANHGVIVTGRNVAEAYDRLYSLERACRVQLHALWTGLPLKPVAKQYIEKAQSQFSGTRLHDGQSDYKPGYELHFDALKRLLDRREPDYKD